MPNGEDIHKEAEKAVPQVFEVGYLIVPTIPEEKLGERVTALKTLIENNKGSFIAEAYPKMKPLAYTMMKPWAGVNRRYDKGYFGWIKFETDSKSILKIKEGLDGEEHLVRYLLIKTVRENTLIVPKPAYLRSEGVGKREGKKDGDKPKVEISEAELDKTIEELVIE